MITNRVPFSVNLKGISPYTLNSVKEDYREISWGMPVVSCK